MTQLLIGSYFFLDNWIHYTPDWSFDPILLVSPLSSGGTDQNLQHFQLNLDSEEDNDGQKPRNEVHYCGKIINCYSGQVWLYLLNLNLSSKQISLEAGSSNRNNILKRVRVRVRVKHSNLNFFTSVFRFLLFTLHFQNQWKFPQSSSNQ